MNNYIIERTVIGEMLLVENNHKIIWLSFGYDPSNLLEELKQYYKHESIIYNVNNNFLQETIQMIKLYLENCDSVNLSEIPISFNGSTLECNVWNAIKNIPVGKTISYSQLADIIGKPKAVRAVASVCAKNKIGLLIPCHRVIKKNGMLSQYRWGTKNKKILLAHENQKDL